MEIESNNYVIPMLYAVVTACSTSTHVLETMPTHAPLIGQELNSSTKIGQELSQHNIESSYRQLEWALEADLVVQPHQSHFILLYSMDYRKVLQIYMPYVTWLPACTISNLKSW